jgi:hypothetical protein
MLGATTPARTAPRKSLRVLWARTCRAPPLPGAGTPSGSATNALSVAPAWSG